MPAVSCETYWDRSQLLLQRLYIRSHEDKRDVQLFPQYGWETAWNGFIDCKSPGTSVCHSARKLILRAFPRPPCYGWYQDRTVWSWAKPTTWLTARVGFSSCECRTEYRGFCTNPALILSFFTLSYRREYGMLDPVDSWIYITVKSGMWSNNINVIY